MPLCFQARVVYISSPCIATEACVYMLIGYYSKALEILSWLFCTSKEIHIFQKEITHTDSSWPGPWMLVSRSVPMGYDGQPRKNDCLLPDGATGLIIIANSDLPPFPEFNWIPYTSKPFKQMHSGSRYNLLIYTGEMTKEMGLRVSWTLKCHCPHRESDGDWREL